MGWQLIDKPKTLRVTRNLAVKYRDMDPVPHDRALSERRLAVYRELFRQGKFRPVTWACAICKETDGLYRVNGKHTSTLLAGLEQLPEFYVMVEEYECDTLAEVADLYSTFDSRMQSRTASDIYMSFAGTVPELAGIHRTVLCAVVSGLAYAMLGPNASTAKQPQERAELLLDEVEFVSWVNDLLTCGGETPSARKHSHLGKQAVIAAMYSCWQKSVKAATDFWTAVRDETGTTPEMPDRKLAKFLLLVKTEKGQAKKAVSGRREGPRGIYVRCLHAWNAWRRKEPTDLRYYSDKDVPEVV